MMCANFQRNLTAHLKDSFPNGKSRVVEKDTLYIKLGYRVPPRTSHNFAGGQPVTTQWR